MAPRPALLASLLAVLVVCTAVFTLRYLFGEDDAGDPALVQQVRPCWRRRR